MSPDDPRHGSNAGYVAGCRAECCQVQRRRQQKRRRYLNHAGQSAWATSEQVNDAIHPWIDMGFHRGYPGTLAWPNGRRPRITMPHDTPRGHDHAVVERFLAGDHHLSTTSSERREIVARWPGSKSELERITGWAAHRYTTREDVA